MTKRAGSKISLGDHVVPYVEFWPKARFAFEPNDAKRKLICRARVEQGLDQFGKKTDYQVADVTNYRDQWFALEFDLPDTCRQVAFRLSGYPVNRLFTKVYFKVDGKDKAHDLVDFNIGEGFNNHRLMLDGLPENLTALRL